MEFVRSTARAMHDDHMAVLGLLDRFENRLGVNGDDAVPEAHDPDWRRFLNDFKAAVHDEIVGHFGFEEKALFPILRDAGEDELCQLLEEQHAVLLPLGMRLAEIAESAGTDGFSGPSWSEFRTKGTAFLEGLRGHVDIEEASMVPAVEDALEADRDIDLIQSYRS